MWRTITSNITDKTLLFTGVSFGGRYTVTSEYLSLRYYEACLGEDCLRPLCSQNGYLRIAQNAGRLVDFGLPSSILNLNTSTKKLDIVVTTMQLYQFLADGILLIHVAIVLFIVGGLLSIVVGNLCHWRWVNNFQFRLAHIAAIGVVVIQSWLGEICPLTTFESWLRTKAGASGYSMSFIEYWVQRLLYCDAPFWIFTAIYTLFGLVVLFVWLRFPPRAISHNRHSGS